MVIGARFLHGLMEGAVHPTFYAMAGKWLPAQEKASLVSLAMFGECREEEGQTLNNHLRQK